MNAALLTAIVPTRNRPDNLPGQLRLLRDAPYPVLVVDLGDPPKPPSASARACIEPAQYRAMAPRLTFYDKLAMTLDAVETPFVVLIPDPQDHVSARHRRPARPSRRARGPRRGAGLHRGLLGRAGRDRHQSGDLVHAEHRGRRSASGVTRYRLMQRLLESWAFAVFRTAPLRHAMMQARQVDGAIFQEALSLNALALQGKMARLPLIQSLQSEERSFHPSRRNDPFFWFLDDPASFARHYAKYRGALTGFIGELGIAPPPNADLDRFVDMVHAIWLHRRFDDGMLNHTARLLLGDALAPLPGLGGALPWAEPAAGDIVSQRGRRYIWRDAVLRAEPRDEISISGTEMMRVMAALDVYFGAADGAGQSEPAADLITTNTGSFPVSC